MAKKKKDEFVRVLEKQMKTGKPISIYTTWDDPRKLDVGVVLAVTNKHVLLASMTYDGFYDGFICFAMSEVNRIEASGPYEKNCLKLYIMRKQKHPSLHIKGSSLMRGLLRYARKKKLIISVHQYEKHDELMIGFVKKITSKHLRVKLVGTEGRKEGEAICALDSITRVYVDGKDENSRMRLYNARKK